MEETLLPLLGFAIATSVTPGPNVLMVAASAANHGLRATWPHMIGITLGFSLMLLVVGLGLAGPFAASPALHEILRWVGAANERRDRRRLLLAPAAAEPPQPAVEPSAVA